MQESGLTDIKIYAVIQHSHNAGTSMRTRHFRNGVELTPIITENNYDADFQQTRMLQKRIQILPVGTSYNYSVIHTPCPCVFLVYQA